MIKHIFALLLGSMLGLLYACNSANFPLGQDLTETKTNVITTDTCTVHAFTFKEDSIRTSGTGRALVGSYTDGNFGTIQSSAFFAMAIPVLSTTNQAAISDPTSVFDSAYLCVKYDHYSFGDTTKVFSVKAYSLSERIDDRINLDQYLYNTSIVHYDTLLGEGAVVPKPARPDSIVIKLEPGFSNRLFSMIKEQTTNIQDQNLFLNYFKGFALVPGNSNSSVLGLSATDTGTYIRVQYHIGLVNYSLQVKMLVDGGHTSKYQFNRIVSNFGTSPLNTMQRQEDVVPSGQTNNQTYCQAGTAIMTRLEFPYIKQLLEKGNMKILKAQLILSPLKGSYHSIPLPSQFNLYSLDNLNTFENIFSDSRGTAQTGIWTYDYEFNEQTAYTFDVTNYIETIINQTSTVIPAIGVSISSDQYTKSLSRVVLDFNPGNRYCTKLRVLYWRY